MNKYKCDKVIFDIRKRTLVIIGIVYKSRHLLLHTMSITGHSGAVCGALLSPGFGRSKVNKKYYWFGEKRGRRQQEGVNVYSSGDLYNWKFQGLALASVEDTTSDADSNLRDFKK